MPGILIAALVVGFQVTGAPTGAVPPPPEQAFAHCARPVYATEHLICETPELLEQEMQLAAIWAGQEWWAPGAAGLEDQGVWFRRRAMCAFEAEHRGCVERANAERLAVLRDPDRPPPAPLQSSRGS